MFNFSRKDKEFFELFWENAKYFNRGAILLDEIIKDPNQAAERKDEILALEASADNVNEKIVSKLNISFITPIDRERFAKNFNVSCRTRNRKICANDKTFGGKYRATRQGF